MSVADRSADIRTRPGTTDDIPDVLDVWRRAETHGSATDDAGSANALIEWDCRALLIAEDATGVIGTLIAVFDGWRGNMYRLAVLPSRRRRGVARRLVEEGERILREQGAHRITALVAHEQTGAQEFWAVVGYERDPHTERSVKTF